MLAICCDVIGFIISDASSAVNTGKLSFFKELLCFELNEIRLQKKVGIY